MIVSSYLSSMWKFESLFKTSLALSVARIIQVLRHGAGRTLPAREQNFHVEKEKAIPYSKCRASRRALSLPNKYGG